MPQQSLSSRLRDALAVALRQREDIQWEFSVRYSEVDGTAVGWGFDVDRPSARPFTVWFDDAADTCRLEVPRSVFRRGLVVTWTEVSDAEGGVSAVLDAVAQRFDEP